VSADAVDLRLAKLLILQACAVCSCLIMGIMVNDGQAGSTRPTRLLAWDTTGDPTPVAEAVALGRFSVFSVLAGVFHSFLTALKLADSGLKMGVRHRSEPACHAFGFPSPDGGEAILDRVFFGVAPLADAFQVFRLIVERISVAVVHLALPGLATARARAFGADFPSDFACGRPGARFHVGVLRALGVPAALKAAEFGSLVHVARFRSCQGAGGVLLARAEHAAAVLAGLFGVERANVHDYAIIPLANHRRVVGVAPLVVHGVSK
jgi:hypothetical protein